VCDLRSASAPDTLSGVVPRDRVRIGAAVVRRCASMTAERSNIPALRLSVFFSETGVGVRFVLSGGRHVYHGDLWADDRFSSPGTQSMLIECCDGAYYVHCHEHLSGRVALSVGGDTGLVEIGPELHGRRIGPVARANLLWKDGLQVCVEQMPGDATEDAMVFPRPVDWDAVAIATWGASE
jgi:hypothetical protein